MTGTRRGDVDVREQASETEEARGPESPRDLTARTWRYVVRKTWHEFSNDRCTDLAAALTYYSVLALFPAAVALVSLLGVVGQAQSSVNTVIQVLRPLVSPDTLRSIQPSLEQIAHSHGAGVALVIGILGALWSASGYVGAFGRAMNRIYEIDEGRPFWKLRPVMLLVTLVAILMVAAVLVMLIVSGPLATSIGDQLGVGSQALTIWNIAKWPVILVVVTLIVAMLYYATPNVKQPRFRWISVGAGFAIVVWVLASVAFALYVASFGSYNKTYGALAGAVVGLLWIWITNVALLLGAEIDSELERGRQLEAGVPAESELQLPPRDTRGIRKARRKEQKDVERGRLIRERAGDRETATNEEKRS